MRTAGIRTDRVGEVGLVGLVGDVFVGAELLALFGIVMEREVVVGREYGVSERIIG